MGKLKMVSLVAAIVLVFGILLASAGYVIGGVTPLHIGKNGVELANNEAVYIDEELPQFKNIEVEAGAVALEFKEGSTFKIYGTQGSHYSNFNYNVSGDTLYIDQQYEDGEWFGFFGWSDYGDMHITIEYPAGTEFGTVTLDNDAAEIYVDTLIANRLNISLDAGYCELIDVKAKVASLDVSAGSLYAENLETESLEGDCDAGDIEIDGIFRGLTEFECDAGSVYLTVNAPEKYFSYSIKTDFGDAEVNGEEYRGAVMNDSKNQIHIETSAGSVNLDFTD